MPPAHAEGVAVTEVTTHGQTNGAVLVAFGAMVTLLAVLAKLATKIKNNWTSLLNSQIIMTL